MASPLPLHSLESVSVPSSRQRVCTRRGEGSMSASTQYQIEVQDRKDWLHASLTAWQRREGKSREQFADALSLATGEKVTAKMVENWLERGALQRQMPATMEPYWRSITRVMSLPPTRERHAAVGALDDAEFYESRRQA